MFYNVSATLNRTMAPELLRRLKDGSIAEMPNGTEIFFALVNASVSFDERVHWRINPCSQCRLEKAKDLVFDLYFDDINYSTGVCSKFEICKHFVDYIIEIVEEKYEAYFWLESRFS